jgi:hypothetical protein
MSPGWAGSAGHEASMGRGKSMHTYFYRKPQEIKLKYTWDNIKMALAKIGWGTR